MGGALALTIRSELFLPGAHFMGMGPNDFERIFTVHGTDMLLLWVIPFGAGVGNYLIPILVRYKDMAPAKLTAAAWMIPVAASLIWLRILRHRLDRLSSILDHPCPGPSTDMWIFGMKILGISSVLGSINFVVTILKMKHPDLPLMKMSLFAWGILVQSFMIIVAMPTFSAAMIMMYTDRLGVSGFFNPAMGGDPIAYQHLFWFTFHPEVYIFLLPAIGMAYEIIPKFSRKPIFSYQSGVTAFVMLGTIGFASWAHHMFATGMSFTEKTVFMIGTLAAVPASTMHVFNFVATMWGGRIKFVPPMLFTVGGIMLFYAAGAGGVVNTAIPLDFLTHDSYFVVGHFHLFMMGTVTMIFTGVIYFLFPLITGRMYNERAAQVQFIVAFVGIAVVFGTQHILGLYGQPRRTFDYTPLPQFIIMNQIATIGAWIVGPAYGLMLVNLIKSAINGKPVEDRDPFAVGEIYYDYARREPHYETH